jgi:ribonuclease D
VSFPNSHTAQYLDTPEATTRFLRDIASAPALAVDTEGASFHRFVDRIYLIQVSTRERTAIIDPLAVAQLDELGALLADPGIEIVFHDADYDLRLLRQDYGWQVRRLFDTRVAAQLLGIRAFGLGALLERYFGVKLEKKFQRADWSMRPLTPGMLDYASQDTMHLLELRDLMAADLERAGRMPWAEEEFSVVQDVRWSPDDPAGAFLRMKGARDLSRRELAVLRELVGWRDDVARELDRALFRVVGNEQLFDLARAQPDAREGLSAVKGMPRGIIETRGDDVLAAIRRGRAVPEDALPKFPKSARWNKDPDFDVRVSALKTARDAVAERLDLDPGVLCSKDRLEAVARRNPATPPELGEVSELRRWQRGVLGDEFLRVLASHRRPGPAASPESPYRE